MELEYLTRREVSKLLRVSMCSVDVLIKDGSLEAVRPTKRRVLVPRSAIEKLLSKTVMHADAR